MRMTMNGMEYDRYLDKVYGCWLGKCISGNIGAPYEGMKQILNFEYSPAFLDEFLPNDDLDLQVIWLEVLEKYGVHFTSQHLAEAFSNQCSYAPGEYAYFKKNFQKGIYPPLSGEFNNKYYFEGMGSPIRSEIWACISAGNPSLAAELAKKDAVLDHFGNSVYGEQFLAALEAMAFFENDPGKLIRDARAYIPEESKLSQLISDVVAWCSEHNDFKFIRSLILKKYGHPDCTNLYQNMGIIVMALLLGQNDIIRTTMLAVNCGYDTDCTAATVGAVLGIINGGKKVREIFQIGDIQYKLGVDVVRPTSNVYDLAVDVARMGIYFSNKPDSALELYGFEGTIPVIGYIPSGLSYEVTYEKNIPAVGIGERRSMTVTVNSRFERELDLEICFRLPEKWFMPETPSGKLLIPRMGKGEIRLVVAVPEDIPMLHEKNIIVMTVREANGLKDEYLFGLSGAHVWKMYGPFWRNIVEVPQLNYKESYWNYVSEGESREEGIIDRIRNYHLNTYPLNELEEPDIQLLINGEYDDKTDAAYHGEMINVYEDYLNLEDWNSFSGQCTYYLYNQCVLTQNRTVGIQIGYSSPFQLWINGRILAEKEDSDWCTAENVHKFNVDMQKGKNDIVIKVKHQGKNSEINLFFSEGGACSNHIIDFASGNMNQIEKTSKNE